MQEIKFEKFVPRIPIPLLTLFNESVPSRSPPDDVMMINSYYDDARDGK